MRSNYTWWKRGKICYWPMINCSRASWVVTQHHLHGVIPILAAIFIDAIPFTKLYWRSVVITSLLAKPYLIVTQLCTPYTDWTMLLHVCDNLLFSCYVLLFYCYFFYCIIDKIFFWFHIFYVNSLVHWRYYLKSSIKVIKLVFAANS